MKKSLSEAIGTFALVFVGTGAIIVNDITGGVLSHLGVALAFGLIVMIMICSVGDISGAHLNPAVTIGFWVARRLPGRELPFYIAAQCAGALVGSALLRLLFLDHAGLGVTVPSGALSQSFVLEAVLTFFLMFVILGVATGAKEKGVMAGVAVGAAVWLGGLFGGPISGASMNPARSLGPAIVAGQMTSLWLYMAAPVLGAFLAVQACKCVRDPGCCDSAR